VSDFFRLPFGPAFTAARRAEPGPNRDRFRDRRRVWEHTEVLTWAADPAPSESDTLRAPTEPRTPITKAPTADHSDSGRPTSDASESTAPVEPEPNVDAMPTPNEISVPDEIATSERVARTSRREARTAPNRGEDVSRIRALIRRQKNGDRLSAEERREVMSTVRRVAERQNARRVNSRNGRSDRLRQQAESSRDHALENQSPRPPSDADQPQTETDRSASEPPRSDRPEARPERPSPSDRSRTTDDSSDDETEN
jgi:hypothetical protein